MAMSLGKKMFLRRLLQRSEFGADCSTNRNSAVSLNFETCSFRRKHRLSPISGATQIEKYMEKNVDNIEKVSKGRSV